MSTHDSGQKQITNIRRCELRSALFLYFLMCLKFRRWTWYWGKMDHADDDFPPAPASRETPSSVSSFGWHASMRNKSSKQFALSIFRMEHCTTAVIRKHIECSFALVRCSVCNYKLIIRQSHVFRVIWKWLKMYRAQHIVWEITNWANTKSRQLFNGI